MKLEITKGLDNFKYEFHYSNGHIDDFKNNEFIKQSNLFSQAKLRNQIVFLRIILVVLKKQQKLIYVEI